MADAERLVRAAMNGDTETVRQCIDAGVDVDVPWDSRTALLAACKMKRVDTVRLLLSAGAAVNTTTGHWGTRSTALITAAEGGQVDIIKLLLAHGAEVNVTDRWRYSALLSAAAMGHVDCQEILIESGANVDQTGIDTASALHCCTGEEVTMKEPEPDRKSTQDSLQLCTSLIRAGADPNIGEASGRGTPLHVAARGNHIDMVRLLLEAGAHMNAVDTQNKKPVDVAPYDSVTRDLLLSPSPLALCELCRLVVWTSLGKERFHKIDKLNIPTAHKAFLRFINFM